MSTGVSSLSTGLSAASSGITSLSTSASTGINSLSTGVSSLSTGLSTAGSSITSLSTSASTGLSTAASGLASLSTVVASLSTGGGGGGGIAIGAVVGLPYTTNNPVHTDGFTYQKVGVSVAYSTTIHAPQVSLPDLWCNYGTPKTATDTGGTAAYTQIVTDNAGKAVAAASGSLAVTVDDGANWLKLAGNWNSADQNGSECVAVGDNGLVARSTTGAAGSWAIAQPLNKTTSWKKVRWIASLSLWVAVGVAGAASTASIMTSPTGVTWTSRQTSASAAGFNTFVFGNSLLVAVGTGGGIQTSANATAWTAQASGTTSNLQSVVWSGTIWVAAGTAVSSLNASTSTAGTSAWTARLITAGTTDTVNCLLVATNVIVAGTNAASATAIRTSPVADGVTWTSRAAGAANILALESDGTTVVGLAAASGGGCSSPLSDCTTWTARSIATGVCTAGAIRYINSKLVAVNNYTGASDNLAEITGGTTPAATTRFSGIVLGSSGAGAALRDAVYFNSTYLAFGDGLSITGSTDAATWTPQNWVPTSAPASSVYGASTFVLGLATGWVLVSTDAKQWIHKNTNATSGTVLLRFANSLFVALTSGAATGNIATSADALTWTQKTGPAALSWKSPACYGASMWAMANQSTVYTTTDFITFTSRVSQPGAMHFCDFGAGWFVACDDYGNLYTSSNGTSWTNRGTVWGYQYANVMATDGTRIVVCSALGAVYSDNGVNWYALTLNQLAPSYYWYPIFANGKFVFAATATGAFGCDFFFGADPTAMKGGQCSSASPTSAVVVTATGAGNGKIYIAQSVAGSIAVIPDTLSAPSSIFINSPAGSLRTNNYGRTK